ncbi:glycosyltransferase family 4 protein [Parafilimonas sp.]|uniref:glycosyltransferase family 4 protein n=1 Tax=Parafilimonas sp. TaxID=1969739 RepID=UPI003F7E369E
MITVALISPNKNVYSETFIQNHKNKINANIKFLFGGTIPTQSEDGKFFLKYSFINRVRRKLHRLFKNNLSFHERKLIQYFKQEGVQVVLAEYGMTGAEMMNICKHLHIPLIIHFHGLDAYHIKLLEQYKDLYILMFKQAFKVIAVSNHMVQQLILLGCPAEKIELNPYGPADDFFYIKNNYQSNTFLAVGRFVEKKAPQKTIEAFKKVKAIFPDAHLKMVGDGPLFTTCEKLIHKLNLSNSIELIGVLNPEKIRILLSESLAFVQHSVTASDGDSEGTPVAILEASAAALPVIATKHTGITDVIIQEKTGLLVQEHDVDGMANNMIRILKDKMLAKEMGKAGRENIKQNFSLKKHISKLEQIINNTCSQHQL